MWRALPSRMSPPSIGRHACRWRGPKRWPPPNARRSPERRQVKDRSDPNWSATICGLLSPIYADRPAPRPSTISLYYVFPPTSSFNTFAGWCGRHETARPPGYAKRTAFPICGSCDLPARPGPCRRTCEAGASPHPQRRRRHFDGDDRMSNFCPACSAAVANPGVAVLNLTPFVGPAWP